MDADALRGWVESLDAMSYYDIFRVPPGATADAIRDGFHAFAESFHPDAHLGRSPRERAAIAHVFKRGAEAYRVLSDPRLRARYDEALAGGILRPESIVVEADDARRSLAPAGPARLIDKVRAPGARPFVLRAEELLKKGDPKQAKLQLVMAMHMDAKNPALEAFARELDEAVKAKGAGPR